MKALCQWLEENKVEHEEVKCGNPYYFEDGFFVPAVTVSFPYDLCENDAERIEMRVSERKFALKMKRNKHLKTVSAYSHLGSKAYRVFHAGDYEALQEHERRVQAAVEEYWEKRHRELSAG